VVQRREPHFSVEQGEPRQFVRLDRDGVEFGLVHAGTGSGARVEVRTGAGVSISRCGSPISPMRTSINPTEKKLTAPSQKGRGAVESACAGAAGHVWLYAFIRRVSRAQRLFVAVSR